MVCSGGSTLLMTRFRRTKPLNAYWLGRSMEHLAVAGTFGSPLPAAPCSGVSSASTGTSATTPAKGRHRLVTEPCYVNEEFNEDVSKCTATFTPLFLSLAHLLLYFILFYLFMFQSVFCIDLTRITFCFADAVLHNLFYH